VTVTITGAVTVGGQQFPVSTQVELPDTPAIRSAPLNHLRAVPKAS
jgi:hypothetical protein